MLFRSQHCHRQDLRALRLLLCLSSDLVEVLVEVGEPEKRPSKQAELLPLTIHQHVLPPLHPQLVRKSRLLLMTTASKGFLPGVAVAYGVGAEVADCNLCVTLSVCHSSYLHPCCIGMSSCFTVRDCRISYHVAMVLYNTNAGVI